MDRHNSAAASSNYSLTVKIYTGTGEWVGLEDAGKTAQHSDDEASPWPQNINFLAFIIEYFYHFWSHTFKEVF